MGVYGQLFANNGSLIGNEFRINQNVNQDQLSPQVASLSNANWAVMWNSDQNGITNADFPTRTKVFVGKKLFYIKLIF